MKWSHGGQTVEKRDNLKVVRKASNNRTVANALAWKRGVANSVCNAKFKVGDRVAVVGEYARQRGKTGSVSKIDASGFYTVKLTDGTEARTLRDDDLTLANSSGAVANAPIFKVYRRVDGKWAFSPDRKLRIFDTYEEAMDAAEKTVGYNSRNAVVNAALAWKKAVCNAKGSDGKEIKVGDKIEVYVGMSGWDGVGIVTAFRGANEVQYKDVFGHLNWTQLNSVRKAK